MSKAYCCRKCKFVLFTSASLTTSAEGDILSHGTDDGGAVKDFQKNRSDATIKSACSSWFLCEPYPAWMKDVVQKEEENGKIPCPKCEVKAGIFCWSGAQCACGRWIVPAIYFPKSKLDERTMKATTT